MSYTMGWYNIIVSTYLLIYIYIYVFDLNKYLFKKIYFHIIYIIRIYEKKLNIIKNNLLFFMHIIYILIQFISITNLYTLLNF